MCFSLGWIQQVLVWLIIVAACVAIIQLLIPRLAGVFGSWGPIIVQILQIILWAFIAIVVIGIIFSLFSCMLGGGLSFPGVHR